MKNWKDVLNGDPTAWLLEESNPSVRYFALRWLLDRPEEDAEMAASKEAIAQSEPVRKFLAAQHPDGRWRRDRKEAYHTIHYYLMILEHLGCPRTEGIERAIEYQFSMAQQEDGALSCYPPERGRSGVIPCYAASALHYLYFWGYGEDPRTQRIVDYLLQNQLEEGGWLCSERVKKSHSCFWATAKVLKAFQELPFPDKPSERQNEEVNGAMRRAADLFLRSGLYKHHREFGKRSEGWFKLGYPLLATDILDVLELVAPYTSPDDERIQEGLNLVLSRQDEKGRWPQEKCPSGRWPIEFEEVGAPSKWVTLHALRMLKRLYK